MTHLIIASFSGLFSILYLGPALCSIGMSIYEWMHMDSWMTHWQERACRDEVLKETWHLPCRQPGLVNPIQDKPWMAFYMTKYVALFVTAAFSGTWVWVPKTFATWRHVYHKLSGRDSNVYDTPAQASCL